MDKEKRKHILEQISTILGIMWAGIGLVAGILFPMIYMVPLLFSSWALFASIGYNSWANSYLMIWYTDPKVYIPIYIIEALSFFGGLTLFLLGIAYLVKGRYHKKKLVVDGPYRYIRHPQNLGILLMIFPFTLYLPFMADPGIRTGDILSWILMGALMCISSLIEEKILISRIGSEYLEYRSRTGFFLPRVSKKRRTNDFTLWKSVLLILGIYVTIVLALFGIERILLELGLVMWTRTF